MTPHITEALARLEELHALGSREGFNFCPGVQQSSCAEFLIRATPALLAVARAAAEEHAACEAQSERVMKAGTLEECYDETMLALGARRELARRAMGAALAALAAVGEAP